MTSLKAVLINDYSGNNLFSYFGNDVRTDALLFAGMFCALDSFNKELLGAGIKSMTCRNGLRAVFDEFYLEKRVTRHHLIINSNLLLDEPLVSGVKPDEYVIGSSIPVSPVLGSHWLNYYPVLALRRSQFNCLILVLSSQLAGLIMCLSTFLIYQENNQNLVFFIA